MSKEDSVLKDIESGKGLTPISTNQNNNTSSDGLRTESRGQNSDGIRMDRFTANGVKHKDGEK